MIWCRSQSYQLKIHTLFWFVFAIHLAPHIYLYGLVRMWLSLLQILEMRNRITCSYINIHFSICFSVCHYHMAMHINIYRYLMSSAFNKHDTRYWKAIWYIFYVYMLSYDDMIRLPFTCTISMPKYILYMRAIGHAQECFKINTSGAMASLME